MLLPTKLSVEAVATPCLKDAPAVGHAYEPECNQRAGCDDEPAGVAVHDEIIVWDGGRGTEGVKRVKRYGWRGSRLNIS